MGWGPRLTFDAVADQLSRFYREARRLLPAHWLRDRLGKHQDILVLAGLTAPHRPLAPWRSRLADAIAERRAAHVGDAARIAARIFVEKPTALRRRLGTMWAVAAISRLPSAAWG